MYLSRKVAKNKFSNCWLGQLSTKVCKVITALFSPMDRQAVEKLTQWVVVTNGKSEALFHGFWVTFSYSLTNIRTELHMNWEFHTLRFTTKVHMICLRNEMEIIIFNNGQRSLSLRKRAISFQLEMVLLNFATLKNKRWITLWWVIILEKSAAPAWIRPRPDRIVSSYSISRELI